jgi:hypothetical protein
MGPAPFLTRIYNDNSSIQPLLTGLSTDDPNTSVRHFFFFVEEKMADQKVIVVALLNL